MSATTGQVPRASSFERWLHLAHEILISLSIANLDVKDNVGGHVTSNIRERSLQRSCLERMGVRASTELGERTRLWSF
jgi:hypothetical protein